MFKSIKWNIKIFAILMVLITSIVTMMLVSYKQTGTIDLTFDTLIVVAIGVLILVSIIISSTISKGITMPMKKMERAMNNIVNGKTNNINKKMLTEHATTEEMQEFVHIFNDMMNIVNKRNFDLNSEESKTEIILEHMADGVVAFSVNKQVIHMNKAAVELMGFTKNEDTFEKVIKKIGVKLDFDKIMYLPNYKNIEQQVNVNDNELKLVLVPYHSNKLMPMGVIMIIKNITETIKLDNMRKEFVANVSHELKTPLTSIKGYSETILNGGLSEEQIQHFIKVINNEANRMNRLVADLLQLSRFDYQKNKFNAIRFNLDDLAKEVAEKMEFVAKEKQHELSCVVNMVPPPIYADKDAIEQVIINVVSNSIKYTPNGGQITIYVGSLAGKAYLKVVDNGIGIPEKDLKRIFERFYRVDKARSRSMGGTGLGLSIVKEIVASHDGTIDIKSEQGIGTEVIVTIPTIK